MMNYKNVKQGFSFLGISAILSVILLAQVNAQEIKFEIVDLDGISVEVYNLSHVLVNSKEILVD